MLNFVNLSLIWLMLLHRPASKCSLKFQSSCQRKWWGKLMMPYCQDLLSHFVSTKVAVNLPHHGQSYSII